jgi:protein TonB
METGPFAERRVQAACVAASAAVHVALLLALRGATPTLHILQPAPILVSLYDVGVDAAGPGRLGPELGVDPLTTPLPPSTAKPTPAKLRELRELRPVLDTPQPKPAVAKTPPPAKQPAKAAEPPRIEAKKEAPVAAHSDAELASNTPSSKEDVAAATDSSAPASAGAAGGTFASTAEEPSGGERIGPLGGALGGTGASAPAYAERIRISYEQQIYSWLERFKVYPQLAQRRRLEGTSTLRVRIDRRGRVLASSLEKPTGQHLLDDAALDMVKRAQPFPPIPAAYPEDTFEFLAPVQFRLR